MPLPKMPTRPAAILSFPTGESATAHATRDDDEDVAPVQPELDGMKPAAVLVPQAKAPVQAPAQKPVAAKPARAPKPAAKPAAKRGGKAAAGEPSKLFVLDTNVLLHDPSSLFRFEEHDIFLPMMTLEELDHQKKGMSEVARNARQVSRSLDAWCRTRRSSMKALS